MKEERREELGKGVRGGKRREYEGREEEGVRKGKREEVRGESIKEEGGGKGEGGRGEGGSWKILIRFSLGMDFAKL